MASKSRKEPRRIDLALRGVAATGVILLLLAAAYLRTTGAIGGNPEVSAQVRNAGGSLRSGSDVKIAGVIVGKVKDIKRGDGGGIRIGLTINRDDLGDVPANVEARILPATVFGTSFVDLVVHDGPTAKNLQEGAVIPADLTQDTLELQQALDDIDRLVKALGPAELQSAISSAAMALDGRGEQIGVIIDRADSYLAKVTPQLPLVRSDLRQLADNLELVDDVAPDLLDATRDGLVTARTIVEQRASITALITAGTSLSQATKTFLASNVDDLDHNLENGAKLLDTLYLNRQVGITGGIEINNRLGDKIQQVIHGGLIEADAVLQTNAPRYYSSSERPRYGGAPTAQSQSATFRAMAGGR